MKKATSGFPSGGFYRAGALFVVCAMLASCSTSAIRRQQVHKNISQWQAAGSPVVVGCRDPFENPFETKLMAPPGGIAPQAYPSLRDFSSAATVAQTPIQECTVIGGSDDAAQIVGAGWGSLGYAPLHAWRPATVLVQWEWTSEVLLHPLPGQEGNFGDNYTYETSTFPERTTVPYGAWYLAYQRIPQDDEQARRQGAGLYAMQGFRCAIHMRDFPAARRYWALALDSNPGSAAAYGQIALQSFFQVLFQSAKNDSGPEYLNLPQDIRRAAWEAAGQRYSRRSGTFTMERAEKAAQAGQLNKIILGKTPTLSLLYCPVFYPDFNPIPPIIYDWDDWDIRLRFPVYMLNSATQRAAGTVGKGQ